MSFGRWVDNRAGGGLPQVGSGPTLGASIAWPIPMDRAGLTLGQAILQCATRPAGTAAAISTRRTTAPLSGRNRASPRSTSRAPVALSQRALASLALRRTSPRRCSMPRRATLTANPGRIALFPIPGSLESMLHLRGMVEFSVRPNAPQRLFKLEHRTRGRAPPVHSRQLCSSARGPDHWPSCPDRLSHNLDV